MVLFYKFIYLYINTSVILKLRPIDTCRKAPRFPRDLLYVANKSMIDKKR